MAFFHQIYFGDEFIQEEIKTRLGKKHGAYRTMVRDDFQKE